MVDTKTSTHGSYGVAMLSRTAGRHLVGSVTDDNPTAIRVAVYRGTRYERGLSGDESWAHTGLPLVEFVMTLGQFGELIMTPDMGVNVPCTLRQVNGERQPEPPEHDSPIERILVAAKEEFFHGEDPSDQAMAGLRSLDLALTATSLTKKVKAGLRAQVEAIRSKLREPGVIAAVAIDRVGRYVGRAVATARMELRAAQRESSSGSQPRPVIDALSIGQALALPESHDPDET